jgi:tryptophan-rich sensory protein
MHPRPATLALTAALSTAAAVVGSRGVRTDTLWYRTLAKPPWQPPRAAFPLVWTPLYASVAYGAARALDASPDGRGRFLALLTANLATNTGWNWAFFDRESPPSGLGVVAVLDLLNLALLREARTRDRTAAVVLVPYAAWTGFATLLNAELWRRNR